METIQYNGHNVGAIERDPATRFEVASLTFLDAEQSRGNPTIRVVVDGDEAPHLRMAWPWKPGVTDFEGHADEHRNNVDFVMGGKGGKFDPSAGQMGPYCVFVVGENGERISDRAGGMGLYMGGHSGYVVVFRKRVGGIKPPDDLYVDVSLSPVKELRLQAHVLQLRSDIRDLDRRVRELEARG